MIQIINIHLRAANKKIPSQKSTAKCTKNETKNKMINNKN